MPVCKLHVQLCMCTSYSGVRQNIVLYTPLNKYSLCGYIKLAFYNANVSKHAKLRSLACIDLMNKVFLPSSMQACMFIGVDMITFVWQYASAE